VAGTFKFELVSPERILLSEDAEQVMVPGAAGDFTVLVGHAPVMSTLRPGVLDATFPDARKRMFVKAGFAEVQPDRLTVLAEHALDLAELDGQSLAAEIEAAKAELADAKGERALGQAAAVVERLKALQGTVRT